MSVTARPLTVADAPAMADILNELETVEPAGMHFDAAEISEHITGPGNDLPLGSIALERGGELVGGGLLDVSPVGDVWKAVLLGGVRVADHGQGHGRRIVADLAAAAGRLRDRDAPGRPGQLQIWVPQGRASVAALARAAGFEPSRYFLDMRIDLDGPGPAIRELPGLRIEPWSPETDESTRLASNASFADHFGSVAQDPERWRHHFAESGLFRPTVSRVARDGDTVVGFVLVQEFAADSANNGYRTGYIARVGTLRAARGAGVASGLLTHTLQALREEGYAKAELGVDADSPTGAGRLYERLGFRQIRRNVLVGKDF